MVNSKKKKEKGKTDTAWDPIFQSSYTVGLSHLHYQDLIRLCLSKDISNYFHSQGDCNQLYFLNYFLEP